MTAKILIADDEEDIREIVQLFLESKGYETIVAYDGVDALDKARSERPDLIILDVMMPLMSGFEVCEKLMADSATDQIRIVMLSAADQSESKQRGLDAGARDYIVKPFEPDHLEKVIARHLA